MRPMRQSLCSLFSQYAYEFNRRHPTWPVWCTFCQHSYVRRRLHCTFCPHLHTHIFTQIRIQNSLIFIITPTSISVFIYIINMHACVRACMRTDGRTLEHTYKYTCIRVVKNKKSNSRNWRAWLCLKKILVIAIFMMRAQPFNVCDQKKLKKSYLFKIFSSHGLCV